MAEQTEQQTHPFFSRELSAEEAQLLSNTVRRVVADDMSIESVQTTRDQRQGAVIVHGRLHKPSHEVFTRWLQELNALGYTPVLRHRDEKPGPIDDRNVMLQVFAGVAPKQRSNIWINVVLFAITVISTMWVGMSLSEAAVDFNSVSDLFRPSNIILGWPFALTLLGILGAHEFGHYFAARYHKVAVTLPYFIPMPFGFGTLGAFIRLKEPVPDQRKLFDIGVAGPLAGLVLAIPLYFIGMQTSRVEPIPPNLQGQPMMIMGNSLLTQVVNLYTFGRILPDPVTGEDAFIGAVALGAWIGLFVTALNLLPVGQLDGGHTVYSLFGKKARYINLTAMGLLAISAVAGIEVVQQYLPFLAYIGYTGWFLWLGLIFFVIGPFHPPALDDVTTLDTPRRLVGYLMILIFILTFVPVPFYFL
ncbi:MAG TPA: site-2 protease family protein [Caldilineaceae bacterium]|nr:site-2 protease family protein [Caldilineaceae bacterium]